MLNRRAAAIVTFLNGISLQPARSRALRRGRPRRWRGLHAAGEGFALTRANALGPDGLATTGRGHHARADAVRGRPGRR